MRIRVHRQIFGRAIAKLPGSQPIKLIVDRAGARLAWLRRISGTDVYQTRCLNHVASNFADHSWPGECVLPVDRLAAICRLAVQADVIDIASHEDDPDRIRVTALSNNRRLPIDARFDLKTMAEPQWSIDPGDRPAMFTAKATDLKHALDRCEPCIADAMPDDNKPVKTDSASRFHLAGVMVEAENSLGKAVGTDGCHLAQVTFGVVPLEEGRGRCRALIPRHAIKAVRSYLDGLGEGDYVVLRYYEKHLGLSSQDDWLLISQPEEWRFPSIDRIWPEERSKASARIDLKSFVRAVKSVARFVDKENPTVRVRIGHDGAIAVPKGEGEAARVPFDVADRYRDFTPIEFPISHWILEGLARIAGKDEEAIVQFFGEDRPVSVSFDGIARFLMMPCNEDPKVVSNRNRKRQAKSAAQPAPEASPSESSSEPESPPEPAVAVPAEAQPEPVMPRIQTEVSENLPPEREPCINCGTTRGGRTPGGKYERSKGRCQSCYNFFRRHGVDKPVATTKGAVA